MESLLKPVTLSPDVDRILQEIRAGTENALYGASSAESEELFAKHVLSLVEGAGLPVLQVMHYRWFLRELARLWRTRQGRDLAFHLELCIRKWVSLGLEPRTLQFLVSEAHERLKAHSLATKARNHEGGDAVVSPIPESGQSVESVDVRSGPGPATGILESSSPGILPGDFSFPGSMAGPRPPADSATGPLESSTPGILSVDSSNPGILS
jgi:hypothetical protein